MTFTLLYTPEAQMQLLELGREKGLEKRFKAVRKALRFLSDNPAHPSLKTHKYSSIEGPGKSEVFEAYAENQTAAAYRIFWAYYPPKTDVNAPGNITIIAITPHP